MWEDKGESGDVKTRLILICGTSLPGVESLSRGFKHRIG